MISVPFGNYIQNSPSGFWKHKGNKKKKKERWKFKYFFALIPCNIRREESK
jgi:hypothetical protein